MDTVRIYIVRHGETAENRQQVMQGQLDTLLNADGERQADLVGNALRDVPFDACYSSDLQRATETARRILVHHPGVALQTDTALRERHMGDLQGRVWGRFPGPPAGLSGEARPPESPEAVVGRAMAWWSAAVAGTAASCVLVVSHGAWIGLLVQTLLKRGAVRAARGVHVGRCLNTGVSIVELPRGGGRGTLLQYGSAAHLYEAEVDAVESNADEQGLTSPGLRN
ncbi:histidine phosphatase superfamily [Gloeopeniophorella convolvens]|nr:histidine phosphatase superfamily [Gloeopeniophorella convolvens]